MSQITARMCHKTEKIKEYSNINIQVLFIFNSDEIFENRGYFEKKIKCLENNVLFK